ncbi:MAG: pyridoxal-phosphate dependent enzyme [Polyangiaceae bacterium]|nr:pyridoxal-phosphate dependent enzyme [Polyangiaceae bacterium]
MGWIKEPSPVRALLPISTGNATFFVKQDRELSALHGGSKPRKLDYVLAAPPFSETHEWAAVGAIGSGNVAAAVDAGIVLKKKVTAHLFWTDVSLGVIDKLAFVASHAHHIAFYRSSVEMAFRAPSLVIGQPRAPAPHLPPGSTTGRGMVGLVRAAFELKSQIENGELPEPERIYLPFGSGGLAVGLAVGLALAGLRTEVHSVAVVSRALSTGFRVRSLKNAVLAELSKLGIKDLPSTIRLTVYHDHLGKGYAAPTAESLAACELLAAQGVHLEPVYSGKAMAALLSHAKSRQVKTVLFWQTPGRGGLPHESNWIEKLPEALQKRIQNPAFFKTRRRVLQALAAAATAATVGVRLSGYTARPQWKGLVLGSVEADILFAAAEALLPPGSPADRLTQVPERVDAYLVGMPATMKQEVHAMLALLEHGPFPLAARAPRFTSLSPAERAAYLTSLGARGGMLADAYRGVRDLVLLGYYQQPETWPDMGYEGPRVNLPTQPGERMTFPEYDRMVAKEGELPRGALP